MSVTGPDIFKDYVRSILETKHNYMENEEDEATYVPYVVNRAIGSHVDCVLAANEMNGLSYLPKRIQYLFLLNIVRGRKRPFQPWVKTAKLENLNIIKEYYNYSDAKAKEALALMSSEQVDEIRKRLSKGGKDD